MTSSPDVCAQDVKQVTQHFQIAVETQPKETTNHTKDTQSKCLSSEASLYSTLWTLSQEMGRMDKATVVYLNFQIDKSQPMSCIGMG